MNQLTTPLGTITIEIDGRPVPFTLTRLRPDERLCPDVAGRYMLEIDFEPDGSEHLISCCLHPSQHIAGYAESGECLMCYGYYSEDEGTKVSIGIESEADYVYDKRGEQHRISDYDYDDLFEKRNGVFINAYEILPFTKTSHFVFGVSWLNDCNSENDHQTWFGADPTIMNKSDAIEGKGAAAFRGDSQE
jgi:hypothetical protein